LEKLLKAQLVLRDESVPRTHELLDLALLLNEQLPQELQMLQVFAVEARYEEGPFALPASREELLAELERRLVSLETAVRSDG
jgi:HEPN domain-containing protein